MLEDRCFGSPFSFVVRDFVQARVKPSASSRANQGFVVCTGKEDGKYNTNKGVTGARRRGGEEEGEDRRKGGMMMR